MVQPYFNFAGKASEAIEFYEKIFGGTNKHVMLYKDMPQDSSFPITDEMKNLVLHAEMTICGTKFNFCDSFMEVTQGNMISISIRFKTTNEVAEIYERLIDGGTAVIGIGPQFYSPLYACVKDKYGIEWQIMAEN